MIDVVRNGGRGARERAVMLGYPAADVEPVRPARVSGLPRDGRRRRRRWRCAACERRYSAGGRLDLTPNPPPTGRSVPLGALGAAAGELPHRRNRRARAQPVGDRAPRRRGLRPFLRVRRDGARRRLRNAAAAHVRRHERPADFIGIDRCPASLSARSSSCAGLGEYLPFRSDSLDQALFATSLRSHARATSRARRRLGACSGRAARQRLVRGARPRSRDGVVPRVARRAAASRRAG